jgi:hypothetical protein
VPELDSALDRLYGAQLADFVAERDALARELREAGKREEAEQLKRVRKPSVPVWTINQVSRRQPKKLGELVEAANQMRTAQEQGESRRLREAIESHRRTLEELVSQAEDILSETGHSTTSGTVTRVWSTVRAASLDPEVQPQLLSGQLEEETESTGFAAGLTVQPSRPAAERSAPAEAAAAEDSERAQRKQAIGEARDELKSTRAQLKERRAQARELEAEERAAHREWQRAAREADKAREALADAEERLSAAEERLKSLGG